MKSDIITQQLQAEQITIQEALHKVGHQGKYQKMAYAFFCFQWILGGCLLMSPIFIFEKPQFQCQQNPQFTIEQCEKWVCQQENPLQYQVKKLSSFVVEFDPPLICSRQWIADTVAALNYGGSIIGFLISIYISDNKGRKIASIIFWFIGALGCAFIGIFNYNIWLSALGFSLANAGVNPTITIHFCFINEHSGFNLHYLRFLKLLINL